MYEIIMWQESLTNETGGGLTPCYNKTSLALSGSATWSNFFTSFNESDNALGDLVFDYNT
jgi:hypothetical protein